MKIPDSAFLRQVELTTDEIERESDAEVLVTIARSSGRYGDIDLLWGALFSLVTLLVLAWSPLHVSEIGLVSNLVVAYLLGWLLSRASPFMRRLLVSTARRRLQVGEAARSAFLRESLDATPNRTGVLLYLSLFEGELEIVADHGLAGALGLAPINAFRHRVTWAGDGNRLKTFLEAFEAFGNVLRDQVPATPQTVHTIPNRPRTVES